MSSDKTQAAQSAGAAAEETYSAAAEVGAVDERDLRAAARQRRRRDGAVDAGAHDEDVELAVVEAVEVALAELHGAFRTAGRS